MGTKEDMIGLSEDMDSATAQIVKAISRIADEVEGMREDFGSVMRQQVVQAGQIKGLWACFGLLLAIALAVIMPHIRF